jgi:hypothetical protein
MNILAIGDPHGHMSKVKKMPRNSSSFLKPNIPENREVPLWELILCIGNAISVQGDYFRYGCVWTATPVNGVKPIFY